jgi:hypothetical protein
MPPGKLVEISSLQQKVPPGVTPKYSGGWQITDGENSSSASFAE